MALIPCYECYKEISEKTPACPQCGAPKDESPFTKSSFSDRDGGSVYFERWGGTYKKFDGPYQSFSYEMGQDIRLCVNAFYKDGEKDGLFERFGENGRIMERVHYVNGKKEGAYVDSKSPDTVETGEYYNGMKNGQFEARYNTKWEDDPEHHHEHGKLYEEGTYKDGKYHGLYKKYGANGRPSSEITYKDGKWHGPSKWYLQGELQMEGCYDMGGECGEWKYYRRTAIFRTLKVEKRTHRPCPPDLADGN